jgi:hypothetical protein
VLFHPWCTLIEPSSQSSGVRRQLISFVASIEKSVDASDERLTHSKSATASASLIVTSLERVRVARQLANVPSSLTCCCKRSPRRLAVSADRAREPFRFVKVSSLACDPGCVCHAPS